MNVSYAALPPATATIIDLSGDLQTQQAPLSQEGPLTLNSSDLGWAGPFSFGMGYGSLDQFSVNAQYTKKLNNDWAVSALGEYGSEMYRFGGTIGARLFDDGFAKISAEQFSQVLPFSFTSGDIDKTVKQNAVGARYQQTFDIPFLRNLNGGVYYSHTPNVELDPVLYMVEDAQAINYRNIAGGRSGGADVGTDLHLTKSTELSAQLYYDHLRYDTEFTESSEDNAQGFGGGLGVKQLLGEHVAVSAVGSARKIYNTYTAGISWLPKKFKGFEISLLAQSIVSHNDTPNNESIGLQIGYNFGAGGIGARYALSGLSTTKDVGEWTNTPAVYMEQVLAVAEEYSEFVDSTKSMMLAMSGVPTITAIEPASGPLTGAESVVIKGANFIAPLMVTFDGVAASHINYINENEIVVAAPAHAAGKVAVQVSNEIGTSEEKDVAQYVYQDIPKIKKISQTTGPIEGGTLITITGENFIGANAVKFGDLPGTDLKVISATEISVQSPPQLQAMEVYITIKTPSGESKTATENKFTYLAAPTVTSVSPNTGSTGGGTAVTITGTNFTGATVVTFGGTAAASFTVVSATQITAITPARAAGLVAVAVTVPGQGTGSANAFTYVAPTVTSVAPNTGPTAGGTIVTITGTNFSGVTSVTFGGTPSTSFTVNSLTSITATTPARAAGAVAVAVVAGPATGTLAGGFTYANPVVTNVSPAQGSTGGQTPVTISGSGFTGATSVTFGGTLATNLVVVNDTTITAKTPGRPVGLVAVVVNTPSGGTGTANAFTYTNPVVTTISPNQGPTAGGTPVTITGQFFTGATGVTIGGTAATSVVAVNDTTITATTGGRIPGTGNVVVTTPNSGTGTLTNGFTYANPSITSISPNNGSIAGGTPVTITGNNFNGATSVTFGGAPGTSLVVVNSTTITVTTPARPAGPVNVVITTPNSGTVTATNAYTYITTAAISSVTPNQGSTGGGTTVTISGQNFTGATAVTFGGTPAISFVVNNSTTITATIPAHALGAVNVVVTTPNGTATLTSGFTYVNPVVSSVSPAVGSTGGGAAVTISGQYFSGATSVTFGGTPASFSVVNDTTISATTPGHAAGLVAVVVNTPNGGTGSANAYTYINPSITSISPNIGSTAGGTIVNIVGQYFLGTTAVTFGGVNATNLTVTDTLITATTPPHTTGPVNVVVATPNGSVTASNGYTYQAPPTITDISPNVGPESGSTGIVITGTNFTSPATVMFGANPGLSVTVNSPTSITVDAPAGVGTVNVTVTTAAGPSTLTSQVNAVSQYIYQPAPVIGTVTPAQGPTSGNNIVSITGSNFSNINDVTFGGVSAASYGIVSATEIWAQVPPTMTAGSVDVVVETAGGNSDPSGMNKYTYIAAPTITTINPAQGTTLGGTSVTITGSNFIAGDTAVKFGGADATSITWNSSNSITVVTPPGSPGLVNVSVTTTGGTNTVPNAYLYQTPPPTPIAPVVLGLSPNMGSPLGGTTVVISGEHFNGVTAVMFGNQAATSFAVNSDQQITAVSPAGIAGSKVDVKVTNNAGTSPNTALDDFTYVAIDSYEKSNLDPTRGMNSLASAAMNTYTSEILGVLASTLFVTLESNNTVVKVGEKLQAHASVIFAGTREKIPAHAQWSTANPDVATVDANGKIMGVAPGSVTILATVEGITRGVNIVVVK